MLHLYMYKRHVRCMHNRHALFTYLLLFLYANIFIFLEMLIYNVYTLQYILHARILNHSYENTKLIVCFLLLF